MSGAGRLWRTDAAYFCKVLVEQSNIRSLMHYVWLLSKYNTDCSSCDRDNCHHSGIYSLTFYLPKIVTPRTGIPGQRFPHTCVNGPPSFRIKVHQRLNMQLSTP